MVTKKTSHKRTFTKAILIVISIIIFSSAAYGSFAYIKADQAVQQQKQAEKVKRDKELALKAIADAKEAKRKEPVIITLPGSKPITALVGDYSLTDSIWAIVSKTHQISIDYIPINLKIPAVATRTDKSTDERSVRADIETPLVNMFAAANTDGNQLMIGSGYRSAALQAIYFNSLANSIGQEAANQSVARPGESEHQTGLAVDITTVSRNCYLDECFAETSDGQWLANNSYKYGFILRYPKGKENITGYRYEPWHFRYVGIDLATALHESGLTLDQAWSYLETADATLRTNGAI